MSIHDDPQNDSNVVMHGTNWYPFESVSALTVMGRFLERTGLFLWFANRGQRPTMISDNYAALGAAQIN